MASVSNLDADMKRLRMSRYTPQAAKEVKEWIEETLGERLSGGDLLELLKDGTILCRYV
jgi:transgelin